ADLLVQRFPILFGRPRRFIWSNAGSWTLRRFRFGRTKQAGPDDRKEGKCHPQDLQYAPTVYIRALDWHFGDHLLAAVNCQAKSCTTRRPRTAPGLRATLRSGSARLNGRFSRSDRKEALLLERSAQEFSAPVDAPG